MGGYLIEEIGVCGQSSGRYPRGTRFTYFLLAIEVLFGDLPGYRYKIYVSQATFQCIYPIQNVGYRLTKPSYESTADIVLLQDKLPW